MYLNLGQYPKALEFYQQALAILKQVGDRAGEGGTLNNIGYLLNTQKQPELAIVFFKQSVSTYEAIRKDLRVLPKEQQQSYTETVASTYRNLADVLLKQDRILEAQQILDLLKVQELNTYLRTVRSTLQPIAILRPEAAILKQYGELQKALLKLAANMPNCKKPPASAPSPPPKKHGCANSTNCKRPSTSNSNSSLKNPKLSPSSNNSNSLKKRFKSPNSPPCAAPSPKKATPPCSIP
ncbi:MAG: tetratricopeptide repeat protein [Leptolyngbyaceae cyanobacterium SU_3_3]|nr:tetratricopeptide repeat protein [Leptolyngbyaceae cyanobacterium SU_3_3]